MSSRLPVLEALRGQGRTRAALFASSAFDPEFFERIVLAGLLGASADADEEPARFHAEMRAALARSPVGCIVDASKRRGGRRLPYDLVEVRDVPFGAKVFLTLSADEARLVVGSGALTPGGFGLHEELFFHARLALDSAADRMLLREVLDFFRASHARASCRGAELAEAVASFERAAASFERTSHAARTALVADESTSIAPPESRAARFVDSTERSLLEQLRQAVPADSDIVRIGVLAPFVGCDAESVHGDTSESFLLALARSFVREGASLPALELGLSWQNVELAPPGPVPPLETTFRRPWARCVVNDEARGAAPGLADATIEYFTPVRIGPKQLELTDARGRTRREDKDLLPRAIETGAAWPIARPLVAAPATLLPALRAAGLDVRLWLHPTASLVEGAPMSRVLHAGLVSVVLRRGDARRTVVLLGSPRPTARALTKSVAEGAAVEAAVMLAFDEELGLGDLVASLVAFAGTDVGTEEPTPAPTRRRDDVGRFVESVVHDPEHEMLEIRWSPRAGAGPWEARYLGTLVAQGETLPEHPTLLEPFLLDPRGAELVFSMGGRDVSVPILVRAVAMLPDDARLVGLDLREVLALLGGRIGRERLATIRVLRREGGTAPVLDVLFGRGITPPDVFRVVFRLAHAVADPHADASFAAFAALIEGREGARVLLELFARAARRHDITRDEAWFYGAELVRAITATRVPDGPDAAKKRALVVGFASEARATLDAMRPAPEGRPFLADVVAFYGHGDER